MLRQLICALALVAFVGVVVEGAGITCSAKKEPNPIGVATKFMKCAAHSKEKGKAGRCILTTIDKGMDYAACIKYLKSVIPAKAKANCDKDLAPCASKVKACKSEKDDASGKTCEPAATCFLDWYNKMCK
ncbi:uncharacterized protein LOC110857539 [Folsomia candida]|uniref:uncharacterized protein LOC110857539 n=1 Tax=Folsomia candida TaxID=158441 RepID=UPI000B908611|nr:uncharacterized protein LOC110857539 [Folsomia candida]